MGRISIDQFAVVNIPYQFYSFDYFLESAAKIGFRNIDLWTGYPHMLLDETWEEQCVSIRESCDKMGLGIQNMMPKVIGWPLNIAAEEDRVRSRAVSYLKRAIDAAVVLGVPSLQLVPGTGLFDRPVEDAWKRSRDSLCQIAEYAESKGKKLTLEALQIVESNLIGDRNSLDRMLREVNSPALGAVVDTTHMEKTGESLDDYFEVLGDRIWRVHLNETDQLPWGLGHGALPVYLSQLNKWNYSGPFSLEMTCMDYYINPHAALKTSFDYLSEALSRQI